MSWNSSSTPAIGKAWTSIAYGGETNMVGCAHNDFIYQTQDDGATWSQLTPTSRVWSSVATAGNADRLVACVDRSASTTGYIYTSSNGGNTWTARIDPGNRKWRGVTTGTTIMYACSNDGATYNDGSGLIYKSTDNGVTWIQQGSAPLFPYTGIATNAGGTVVVACTDGQGIQLSTNSGSTWSAINPIDPDDSSTTQSWRNVALAFDGTFYRIIACAYNNYVYYSSDTGASWIAVDVHSDSLATYGNWTDVAIGYDISPSGHFIYVVTEYGGNIYKSDDDGATTWSATSVTNNWTSIASSNNATITGNTGQNMVACADSTSGYMYLSANYGTSWTQIVDTPPSQVRNWSTVTINRGNGTFRIIGCVNNGYIYRYVNTHVVTTDSAISRDWNEIASDSSGSRLVASVGGVSGALRGLYTSNNGGASWTQFGSQIDWRYVASDTTGTKLIACADSDYVWVSKNSGVTWIQCDVLGGATTGAWRSVTCDKSGTILFACESSGIYRSIDSGATWLGPLASPGNWSSIASNGDGTIVIACINSGDIYLSTDSGLTWNAQTATLPSPASWTSVTVNGAGDKFAACVGGAGEYIYTTTDTTGSNWIQRNMSAVWTSIASNDDGTVLVAVADSDAIHISSDSGINWSTAGSPATWKGVTINDLGDRIYACADGTLINSVFRQDVVAPRHERLNWASIASSSDAVNLVACPINGQIYVSLDSGVNWIETDSVKNWKAVASNNDGSTLVACATADFIYTSTDSGVTWVQQTTPVLSKFWSDVSCDFAGTNMVACVNGTTGGTVWVSTDSGENWSENTSETKAWTSITIGYSAFPTAEFVVNACATGSDIYRMSDANPSNFSSLSLSNTSSPGVKDWVSIRGMVQNNLGLLPIIASSDKEVSTGAINEGFYVSSDSGTSWGEQYPSTGVTYKTVAVSSSGLRYAVGTSDVFDGNIYFFGSEICVTGDTVCIQIIDGKRVEKQIKDIVSGDYVLGSDGRAIKVVFNILGGVTKDFIKISKDAFGENKPNKDMFITGGHPLLVNEKEILASNLVNGTSITFYESDNLQQIYSLCTKERIFVLMNNLDVCVWEEEEFKNVCKRRSLCFKTQ